MRLFSLVQTQWLYAGMGQRSGFNYAGVEAAARIAGIDIDAELFNKLQTLEKAVLDVDREKHNAEKDRHITR